MTLSDGFVACHRNAANLWLHAITTPLGMLGAFSLLALLHGVVPWIAVIWMSIWLLERLPWRYTLASSVVFGGLAAAAVSLALPWWVGLAALVGGYLGQDLAHRLTGEPTFEERYQGEAGWLGHFAEHAVLLVPLILDAMVRNPGLFAPLVTTDRIASGRVSSRQGLADLAVLRDWVGGQTLPTDRTTHWWRRDLPEAEREAFCRLEDSEEIKAIIQERFGDDYVVMPVHRMNEVYVASECPTHTSDTVFYMSHIDGPLSVVPFSSVFRCMVAVTPNRRVTTHFPMANAQYTAPQSHLLDRADVLAFDFNRELHFITEDTTAGPRLSEADGRRVTLKLHFAIVPRALRRWGWLHGQLTGRYNEVARRVFLDTISPRSLGERLGALWVLSTTRTFAVVQRWLGMTNLFYVLCVGGVSWLMGSLALFILLTGFVHYGMYIATFAHRDRISYGHFLRDCIFFKGVSMGTLAVVALTHFTAEPVALLLMVTGFGTAGLAASALGKERTYFGVELGKVPFRRVSRFPYGVIPHPMILGAIVGLLGIHALDGFRAVLPWVIPVHVALYLIHLLQEQVDYRRQVASDAANIHVAS